MDLSVGEVAGLPNGGGVMTEKALKREPHPQHSEGGWGFILCLRSHASLFGPVLKALVSERG
jgi:hypothetical protein